MTEEQAWKELKGWEDLCDEPTTREQELLEQLRQAGDTIGRLTDRIKELESDMLELEYKLATMYEMLHGRKMPDAS